MSTLEMRKYIKLQIDKTDVKTLKMIHAIIEVEKQVDWWEMLSDSNKKSVLKGLEQAKNGDFVSCTTIKNKFGTWLTE